MSGFENVSLNLFGAVIVCITAVIIAANQAKQLFFGNKDFVTKEQHNRLEDAFNDKFTKLENSLNERSTRMEATLTGQYREVSDYSRREAAELLKGQHAIQLKQEQMHREINDRMVRLDVITAKLARMDDVRP